MRLFYTIISTEDGVQTRPDLSLGGFISSTVVPNNSYQNLFSDISCYSVAEARDEYIALALLNETGAIAYNVTLYFNYPDNCQKSIEMAFVAFNSDGEMEIINTPFSAPYNADFNPADGELNSLLIGDIPVDGKVGIWLKKVIDKTAIQEEYSDDNLEANGNPSEADEDIGLVIMYNFALIYTTDVINIAQTTADSGGDVDNEGASPVTERGVCWSTEELPTINDNKLADVGVGTGSFVSNLTGLTAGTTYYLRAYVTNSEGTSYGEQKTFTTLP